MRFEAFVVTRGSNADVAEASSPCWKRAVAELPPGGVSTSG